MRANRQLRQYFEILNIVLSMNGYEVLYGYDFL